MVPSKDIATHRLTVVDSNEEKKVFYLTMDKALAIMRNINSKDQFIVISDTNEIFPKHKAILERISEKERKEKSGNFDYRAYDAMIQQRHVDRKRADEKRAKAVNEWISFNQEEYDKIYEKNLNDVKGEKMGFSEPVEACVAKGRSRVYIWSLITNDANSHPDS